MKRIIIDSVNKINAEIEDKGNGLIITKVDNNGVLYIKQEKFNSQGELIDLDMTIDGKKVEMYTSKQIHRDMFDENSGLLDLEKSKTKIEIESVNEFKKGISYEKNFLLIDGQRKLFKDVMGLFYLIRRYKEEFANYKFALSVLEINKSIWLDFKDKRKNISYECSGDILTMKSENCRLFISTISSGMFINIENGENSISVKFDKSGDIVGFKNITINIAGNEICHYSSFMKLNNEKINEAEFLKTDLGIKYLEEVEKLNKIQKVLIKSAEEFLGMSMKELGSKLLDNQGYIFECMMEKASRLIRSVPEQKIEPPQTIKPENENKANPAAVKKHLKEFLKEFNPKSIKKEYN